MSKPQAPLDFAKVEALRRHMLLTSGAMASTLGVSRITYSGWVHGKPIRATNDARVRTTVRAMLRLVTEKEWPTPAVIAMSSPQRLKRLLADLKSA